MVVKVQKAGLIFGIVVSQLKESLKRIANIFVNVFLELPNSCTTVLYRSGLERDRKIG